MVFFGEVFHLENLKNERNLQQKTARKERVLDSLTALVATLRDYSFRVYLNDNSYSRYGVQFFQIFGK